MRIDIFLSWTGITNTEDLFFIVAVNTNYMNGQKETGILRRGAGYAGCEGLLLPIMVHAILRIIVAIF